MGYRSFREILVAIVLMATLGCGGGGGSEPAPVPPTFGAPSNVTSTLGFSWCNIVLSWSPAQGYAAYELQGKRPSESAWVPLVSTGLTKANLYAEFAFPGLAESEILEFRVVPVGTDGQVGIASPTYSFVVPPKPVSGLDWKLIPSTDTIRLTWDPPSISTTSIDVYRMDSSHQKSLVRHLPPSTTSVDDPDWIEGLSLVYLVVSNHDGMAGYSSGFTTAGSLHVPKDFVVTSGPGKITLSWTSVSTLASGVQVYRTSSPDPSGIDTGAQKLIATLPAGTRSFTDLVPFGVYGYQLVNVASALSGTGAQAFGSPQMEPTGDLAWSVPELRILPEGEITAAHFADPNQWVIRERATYGRISTHDTGSWAPIPLPADFREWASPIVVDKAGRIHALYHPAGSDLYYPALRHGVFASSGWTSTTLSPATWASGCSTIEVSPSGTIWAAWADWGGSSTTLLTSKIREWSDGTWGPEAMANLTSAGYGNYWELLQFYPDASGNPVLGFIGHGQIGFAQKEGEGWITHELPPISLGSLRSGTSSFAAGSGRQIFVTGLIGTLGEGLLEWEAVEGTWGTPLFAFGGDDPNNAYTCTPIASSIDGAQLAYCAFINPKSAAGSIPKCQLRYFRNGTWTTYELPVFGADLRCYFDAQNKLVLIWKVPTHTYPFPGGSIQTAIHAIVHL